MSVCDTNGVQLAPADWCGSENDAPTTYDAETGDTVVVVRFGDGSVSALTPTELAEGMGVGLDQFHEAMAGLVGSGWLVLLEDGTYRATVPVGGEQ